MSVLRFFDPWNSSKCTCPRKYTLNPYTGCIFNCKYCYITSYIGYKKSEVKENLLERVKRDLKRADNRFPVDMSLSSDPYPWKEEHLGLTRKILGILNKHGFKVQITTKSIIFLRDLDIIKGANYTVSLTLTTLDRELAVKLEPNAPSPSKRLKALEELGQEGVNFSVRIDPIIPFLNDSEDELRELVKIVAELGAKHVVTSTYKAKLDNFKRMVKTFPEYEEKWASLYYPKRKFQRRYSYLPLNMRVKILKPIVEEAAKRGLTYATCREGLTVRKFFKSPSCDGTHLLKGY